MSSSLPPLTSDPVIEAYKRHVDVTLIRENLKLSHTERLENLSELLRFAKELARAGQEARELASRSSSRRR